MDPSYKLRFFFLKTAQKFNKLKEETRIKKERQLVLIKEIEDDLFYLNEAVKKMLKDDKMTKTTSEKILTKITKINQEVKKIKKEITNPWT